MAARLKAKYEQEIKQALKKELGNARAMANILAARSVEMRSKGEAIRFESILTAGFSLDILDAPSVQPRVPDLDAHLPQLG